MITIAVCDDDVKFSGKLEMYITNIANKEQIDVDIEVFFSGKELVNNIVSKSKRFDLIFLDIEMQEMNGLDAARYIRMVDEIVHLIYVTSHQSYAIEAYEVQPFRFIVKPIDIAIIRKNLIKVYQKIMAGSFYYQYRYKKEYFRVLVNDILYFESRKRIILIHLIDGSLREFYNRLNDIEIYLQNKNVGFWRIHQSNLVNPNYIIRKSYDSVELINGKRLYISENRRKEINQCYSKIIKGDLCE